MSLKDTKGDRCSILPTNRIEHAKTAKKNELSVKTIWENSKISSAKNTGTLLLRCTLESGDLFVKSKSQEN